MLLHNYRKKMQVCLPLYILAVLLVFCAVSSTSFAETSTGTARVDIRQPVALSEILALNFGSISINGADTITLGSDGSISSLNGANISGVVNTGRFSAAGQANTNVTVSFASGLLSGAGDDLSLNNLTHSLGASPSFDAAGVLIFDVGADLAINDDQVPGVYTGTYQVSVNYQ